MPMTKPEPAPSAAPAAAPFTIQSFLPSKDAQPEKAKATVKHKIIDIVFILPPFVCVKDKLFTVET
jgi:hypothetical protein